MDTVMKPDPIWLDLIKGRPKFWMQWSGRTHQGAADILDALVRQDPSHYGNQSRGYLIGGGPLSPPAVPRLAARSTQSNPRGSGPEVLKHERGQMTAESGVAEVGVFRALQPNEGAADILDALVRQDPSRGSWYLGALVRQDPSRGSWYFGCTGHPSRGSWYFGCTGQAGLIKGQLIFWMHWSDRTHQGAADILDALVRQDPLRGSWYFGCTGQAGPIKGQLIFRMHWSDRTHQGAADI